MKMKKILAAIAACAMSAAMVSMTAFAAPVEGDTEDLPEDPADIEEPIDEEPVDEEPVDEDPEPVVDETPAPVATNPGTGNAPIALAVIPVALAAAAVVAKKAK